MKNKKEYELPEVIKQLQDKRVGLIKLRELYIRLPFGYKKAVKCSQDTETTRRYFWESVFNLYPELKGKHISYDAEDGITINETKEDKE